MSRVGKNPVTVPSGVNVDIKGAVVTVKGPQGELTHELPAKVHASVEGNVIVVTRDSEEKAVKALHGTMRSLLNNMVLGVSKGFSKELEIQGVGFRAQVQGQKLVMTVGFSHPIEYVAPDGVKVEAPEATKIIVSGPDKQKVGAVSARIRDFCPAEPYKGKGIRYKDEHVRRKAGKTVA